MRTFVEFKNTCDGGPSSIFAAVVEKNHAVRNVGREMHLMRHDDHRHALARKLFHHLEHLTDQLRIERRGRFIEQDGLRIDRKRPRDADTLLLAAGKASGILVELSLLGRPFRAYLAPAHALALGYSREPTQAAGRRFLSPSCVSRG